MAEINNIPDFIEMWKVAKKDIIDTIAVEALNFFQDTFNKGGFTDANFEAWQERKNNVDAGRAILVGPGSGFLQRSIDVTHKSERKVEISTDAIYAEIHIPIPDKNISKLKRKQHSKRVAIEPIIGHLK